MSISTAAILAATAAAKGITGAIGQKKARKARKKEEELVDAETAGQSAELAKQTKLVQQGYKDISNQFEGATSISPETQYARNASERATSSAIDKAIRTGASSGEVMATVSGLTGQQQQQAMQISAAEEMRRKQAGAASKQAALGAKQAGLAGANAQAALTDRGREKKYRAGSVSDERILGNTQFYMDALGDLGMAKLYGDMFAGGSQAGVSDTPGGAPLDDYDSRSSGRKKYGYK